MTKLQSGKIIIIIYGYLFLGDLPDKNLIKFLSYYATIFEGGPSGQVVSRQQQVPVQVYLAQFFRNHRFCQHLRAAQRVVADIHITDIYSSASKYIIIFSLHWLHKFLESNMQHIDLHLLSVLSPIIYIFYQSQNCPNSHSTS